MEYGKKYNNNMKKVLTERPGVLNTTRSRCVEGEVGDETDEGIREKQTPQAMVIQSKVALLPASRIITNGRSKAAMAKENAGQLPSPRPDIKIRSRSPREIGKVVLQLPLKLGDGRIAKHLSPQHVKPPQLILHNPGAGKDLQKLDPRSKSPPESAAGRGVIKCSAPAKNLHISPKLAGGRFKLLESEESQMIEALGKKKRQLNDELWAAAATGDTAKIDALLAPTTEDKADVNAVGIEHKAAIHLAVCENKLAAAKLLIRYGANIEAKTDQGRTALHIACILGEADVCLLLLTSGAWVNSQDREGNTSCHYAAHYKNIKILRLLLERKPDITLKNKKTQTPIDVTTSKSIIAVFWNYLAGKVDSGEKEDEAKPKLPDPSRSGKLVDIKQSKAVCVPKPSTGSTSMTSTDGEAEKVGLHAFDPVQMLGKGSFGEVYLVQRKSNQKYYAMKVLQKRKILEQNLTKYAYTEKHVLSCISHPFIVGLHCSFQTSNKLFLVMDYCPGGDLGHVLQRERKLTEERARIYLAEVLLAIEELHNREIIYRDLKPDNVVLDADGHALLTDFGLSKEGIKDNDFTQSFCGSIAYLAPEMLRRSGHGKSVDWYLLGVLLYEMLVGMPPYFARDKTQLFENIKRGPLQIPPGLSEQALDLIVKLLNRDPKHRLGAGPTDAEEIKQHAFFEGIDWDEAKNRMLRPPKPRLMPISRTGLTFAHMQDEPDSETRRLNKWTFVAAAGECLILGGGICNDFAQRLEEQQQQADLRRIFVSCFKQRQDVIMNIMLCGGGNVQLTLSMTKYIIKADCVRVVCACSQIEYYLTVQYRMFQKRKIFQQGSEQQRGEIYDLMFLQLIQQIFLMRQLRHTVLTQLSPVHTAAHKFSHGGVRSATLPSLRQITIIEMGGFHSTMMPVVKGTELIGGAAYVADAVTQIRQKAEPVLISNGDVFTGQTTAIESGGNLVIQFMNQLDFDAMTLGIHDFDEGQEVLAERIMEANFPVLAANLVYSKTNVHISEAEHPLSVVKPYAIVDRGMQSVAVLGLMKEETPMFQVPKNLLGLSFWSAKEAILRWLPDIEQERPDLIVIQYNKMEEAEELAIQINESIRKTRKKKGEKSMRPLLIFIGGHLDEKPITGHNYMIMQGTDRGYRLGVIKIKQEYKVNRLSPEYTTISDKRYHPDPKIAHLVQDIERRIEMHDTLLGQSKEPLNRAKYYDGPLGILITEAMKQFAKAEVAFLSSGTTKIDIDAGDVYSSDIDQAIPFKDSIILMELSGKTVHDILEQSARLEADSGGSGGKILQVAGIRFKYSVKLEKGKRVIEASINGDPIDPERHYVAAVSKYLVDGGDGYGEFAAGKVLQDLGNLKDVVKGYIRANGILDIKRDMRIEYIGG